MVLRGYLKKLKVIGRSLIPFLIISFCFIILGLHAFKAGQEFQVNTSNDWRTHNPAIGMDKRGNFVIAWESLNQDGDRYGIYAQRFNKKGKAVGSEFRVNTAAAGNQQSPAVAMDKKGNFVIVWAYHGIYAQRYNKKGQAVGSEFLVNTFFGYTLGNPAIAMDAQGNFVIVWENNGVYAQRFNKQGTALGTEFQVNTELYQGDPAIAMDAKGNFVITYTRMGQDDEILAQRFNKQGQAQGSEFQVNTYTDDRQNYPAIAMDKKGNFVVTWMSEDQVGTVFGIFAKRFNKKGKAIGSEFQVNTPTNWGDQYYPVITMEEKGDFVITWEDWSGKDGSGVGILAQRFNKKGKAVGSEFVVNTYSRWEQRSPAIARDVKGNFVITWKTETDDASESLIYAKMFKK